MVAKIRWTLERVNTVSQVELNRVRSLLFHMRMRSPRISSNLGRNLSQDLALKELVKVYQNWRIRSREQPTTSLKIRKLLRIIRSWIYPKKMSNLKLGFLKIMVWLNQICLDQMLLFQWMTQKENRTVDQGMGKRLGQSLPLQILTLVTRAPWKSQAKKINEIIQSVFHRGILH